MAIFHMSFSNISAGKGRSAIASAAYRSGEKLFDNQEGLSFMPFAIDSLVLHWCISYSLFHK